jgi:formiminotetrahydrofolate cyclodeaminase
MSYRGLTIWSFLEEVASTKSVPAGGSIAAVSGAMAAALLAKMGRLALRRASGQALRRASGQAPRRRASEAEPAQSRGEGSRGSAQALKQQDDILSHDLVVEAEALRRRLMALAYADGQAYDLAATLSRSGEATDEEIEAAWQEAVCVPLRIADDCERVLELAETLHLAGLVAADVRAVAVFALACLEVQLLNAEVNLARVKDADFRQASNQRLRILREKLDDSHRLSRIC